MLCARSVQKLGGKNKNMKRTNGVRAAYDAFVLRALQTDFGCAAVFDTSNEAYPWPLIVLRHRCLSSFTEAH